MSSAKSASGKARLPSELRPHYKLWLSTNDAETAFGDGRWRLLDALAESSSLTAAAENLGISYRKAWGDLQKAEECLGVKLMERRRGGKGGGETTLTDAGERWLNVYREFRDDVKKAVDQAFLRHFLDVLPSSKTKF